MVNYLEQALKLKKRGDKPLMPLIDQWLMYGQLEDRLPYFLHPKVMEYVQRGKEQRVVEGRFPPSSAGGCERKAVLDYNGVPSTPKSNPKTQRIFDNGHYVHLRLHSYLLAMSDDDRIPLRSITFEERVGISSWWVYGDLDHHVQIYSPELDKWIDYIVDFKSTSGWGFRHVKNEQTPLKNHQRQLVIYARAKKVKNIIVIYEDKETQELEEISIVVTKEMIDKERERIRRLQSYVKKKQLPDIPHECKNGIYFGYPCPQAGFCWPG